MSSEWMRSQGLMAPVEQGAGQVIGQTLGLLSPAAVQAAAPQIAGGLLRHADQFQRYNGALGPAGASPATMWHGGNIVKNPTADKQGIVLDGVPALSFTPSKRSAREYASHNQGAVHALDDAGMRVYKIGDSPKLDKAVDAGDWAAIKREGFDGVEVVPGKEVAFFDYAATGAKAKLAEELDPFSGKWIKR
jgi:hypothetical protein